ncbi:M4 family metallopeptidase [Caenimonas sp. SL110]|uniref:M4 family metallopeptidase n=1 Tax=Caenimonas sp. SL110 TaxID=1450524 RepID=UPI0006529631|nr:M4 family metallopeptidase [Caenimonas sp. SL110]
MNISPARYGCVCFAVPRKILAQMANDTDDDEDRRHLGKHAAQSSMLRGHRAVLHQHKPEAHPGRQALHRQVFDANRSTLLPGNLLRDEGGPPARDKVANQAYDNVGIALQFYKTVLARASVDGKGERIQVSVHYDDRFPNAMWTGRQVIVGDGDGRHFKGFAQSLGIIAHEFSHGVMQHMVPGGLGVVQVTGKPPALKGEAGALNESFCDVFASMIKQWHAGQDVAAADWLVGEDILTPGNGNAIRSLKEPGNDKLTCKGDDQVSDYRHYKATSDAHTGSGIANHAFYIAASTLGGNSWEKLASVWFKGFDRLRPRATFLDAAHATIDVAATLHGKQSDAHRAVKDGWKRVNVLA